jgi:hypothetical protein
VYLLAHIVSKTYKNQDYDGNSRLGGYNTPRLTTGFRSMTGSQVDVVLCRKYLVHVHGLPTSRLVKCKHGSDARILHTAL